MSDRLKTWLAALLAVCAFGLLLASVRSVKPNAEGGLRLLPADQVRPADDFTLPEAATGRLVHLRAEASVRPVVLDFWATWCGPCREELPHLSALARKYAGRVAFYGVNSNDSPSAITAFARQFGMTFPTLSDSRRNASSSYGADALPTLVIIDKHGNVRAYTQGYDPEADIGQSLSKILDTLVAGTHPVNSASQKV